MEVMQLIPLIKLEYNNNLYNNIGSLIVQMRKDELDVLEIKEFLIELGIEKDMIQEILNSNVDSLI